MQVRFFNDWGGPHGKPRLLIGLAADEPDRGQAREAVRVATPEDVTSYPAAYAAYETAMTAMQHEAAGEAEAASASDPAPIATTHRATAGHAAEHPDEAGETARRPSRER